MKVGNLLPGMVAGLLILSSGFYKKPRLDSRLSQPDSKIEAVAKKILILLTSEEFYKIELATSISEISRPFL